MFFFQSVILLHTISKLDNVTNDMNNMKGCPPVEKSSEFVCVREWEGNICLIQVRI